MKLLYSILVVVVSFVALAAFHSTKTMKSQPTSQTPEETQIAIASTTQSNLGPNSGICTLASVA